MSFRDFLLESYYNYLPNNKDKKEKDAVVIHKMMHMYLRAVIKAQSYLHQSRWLMKFHSGK
jgi:hypothetical protein